MASGRIARARLSFPSLLWALKYELKEHVDLFIFLQTGGCNRAQIAFTETEIPCTCYAFKHHAGEKNFLSMYKVS